MAGGLVGLIISLGISLVLGMYVFLTVFAAIPYTGLETAADNATRLAVKAAFLSALGLLGVLIIVLSAKAVQNSI